MADLHRALTNNPFDWYPSNIPVGKDKMPLDLSFVPTPPLSGLHSCSTTLPTCATAPSTLTKLQKQKDKAGSKHPAERSDNRSGKKGRHPDKYSSGRGRQGDRHDRDGYDRGYDRTDRDRYCHDRPRTNDRGDRGRGGNHCAPKSGMVTPSDKKKSSGRGDHAHHIDDGSRSGDSRSARSPSCSRS
jgi:hypothetical protein